MPLSCVEEGRVLTAKITGEIDHHAARSLMTQLSAQVDAALPKELCLDLGGVGFMDSSGIAVVLRTWKKMRTLGGVMTLRAVPAQSGKVLRAAGVDKLIQFTE